MKTYILLAISFFLNSIIIAQSLFSTIDNTEINQYLHVNDELDVSSIHSTTLFYRLNQNLFDLINKKSPRHLEINFPFFDNQELKLVLESFEVFGEQIQVIRQTESGQVVSGYRPNINTYRINHSSIEGVFVFSKRDVKGTFIINGETYQLQKFNSGEEIYFLLNIKNSVIDFDFHCAHDQIENFHQDENSHFRLDSVSGCVEVAVEIDFYTFQTFSNYTEAVDWTLEIISVVSELFINEIAVGLKSNTIQVWEVEDPYANFVEDPQAMLVSIRENWYNNVDLSSVERDLVHLFSKRTNTGTGGIAFLNGLGSEWNGYGFSSNLSDNSDYVALPVPYFFWNLYCFAHEIGHNFGAKHTQWCGWEGGPIDNCTNLEEMTSNECVDYIDNPSPQVGTIMSYCHTWSFESGGGITMKFHELVRNTMMAYIGLQEITSCEDLIILGCVDIQACNYNEVASLDDGSCFFPEFGYDCEGNCLSDWNDDGICDEDNITGLNNDSVIIKIYPNPSREYLKVEFTHFLETFTSFKLFNSIGNLIISKSGINENISLDVSALPVGIYRAQLTYGKPDVLNHEVMNKNIIIQ